MTLKTYNPLTPREPELAEKVRDRGRVHDLLTKLSMAPVVERPQLEKQVYEMAIQYHKKYKECCRVPASVRKRREE